MRSVLIPRASCLVLLGIRLVGPAAGLLVLAGYLLFRARVLNPCRA